MFVTITGVLLAPAPSTDSVRWEPWTTVVEGRTIDGQLGRLRVPVDHAAPQGATIELAFVRLRGTSANAGSPIVYLAGGPGNSGIDNIRVSSMLTVFDSLRTTGDVILLDQRGIGQSRPSLRCPTMLPPTNLFRSEAIFRSSFARGLGMCADSLRATGINAVHYTTVANAADVEAIRRALGAERIRLFGFSYGTHLGLTIIRHHGQFVERAVLAGVEGFEDNEKLPLVFDQNLYRLAAAARTDSVLARLAPDLVAAYDSGLARLRAAPARVKIPHPLVRGDSVELEIGAFGFQHIVARDLGDSNDWPLLPGLIVRTSQGDYGLLAQFARRRWGPLPSLISPAVDCASGSSAARAAEAERQARISRFGSSMNFFDAGTCRAVRAADLGETFRQWTSNSAVPTLFISGSLDNQTPPFQAERIRWSFPHSAHIVVENAGHESTLDAPTVASSIAQFMRGNAVSSQFVQVALPAFRRPSR